MFSRFRRTGPSPNEVKAYQKGQEFGAQMADAFQLYQTRRFGHVHDSYLGILRDGLQAAIRSDDAPPAFIASSNSHNFVDNVDLLQRDMVEETRGAMTDWLEVAKEIGALDDVELSMRESIASY
jgi:hypothetical protein